MTTKANAFHKKLGQICNPDRTVIALLAEEFAKDPILENLEWLKTVISANLSWMFRFNQYDTLLAVRESCEHLLSSPDAVKEVSEEIFYFLHWIVDDVLTLYFTNEPSPETVEIVFASEFIPKILSLMREEPFVTLDYVCEERFDGSSEELREALGTIVEQGLMYRELLGIRTVYRLTPKGQHFIERFKHPQFVLPEID